jgi:hypothetical protein
LSACNRCEAQLERGELRCPICAFASVTVEAREVEKVQLVRCGTCRASVGWDPTLGAARCAYCGSVAHLELAEDPPERAETFLPFIVQPEEAKAEVRKFLARKSWFRPADLSREATLEGVRALWWPAWMFEVDALVSWAADSNVGASRAPWAPHSGQFQLSLSDVLVSASRGLSVAETQTLTPGYDINTGRPSPEGVSGVVEPFDTSRSGARGIIQRAISFQANERAKAAVPGTRSRNLHTALVLEGLRTRRLALPAYVLAYRYKGKPYRVVLNGQAPGILVGRAPLSGWRVAFAVLLALFALGALLFGAQVAR